MNKNCAVILTSGKAAQNDSSLHEVLFTPAIDWVYSAVSSAGISRVYEATDYISQAEAFIRAHSGANALIISGDTLLFDSEPIMQALDFHITNRNCATVVCTHPSDDGRLGKAVTPGENTATAEETSCGIYWFDCDAWSAAFDAVLSTDTEPRKVRIEDIVSHLRSCGKRTAFFIPDCAELDFSASNRSQIMQLNETARKRVIEAHIANGVSIPCADGIIITPGCEIGANTVILPGTLILGKTKIGCSCTVGPFSRLEGCTVGDSCTINASQCERSIIGSRVSVGPFSHLRPDTFLADSVRAGNFTEIKNSNIGEGTSISHLSYIGDSDVGTGVNVGCGCATANYDGTNKFRSTVGNNVFLGCHTCMVSPVNLGNSSYTAAGSVITEDVPEGTMAIARSRQTIKRKVRKYHEN